MLNRVIFPNKQKLLNRKTTSLFYQHFQINEKWIFVFFFSLDLGNRKKWQAVSFLFVSGKTITLVEVDLSCDWEGLEIEGTSELVILFIFCLAPAVCLALLDT